MSAARKQTNMVINRQESKLKFLHTFLNSLNNLTQQLLVATQY
uniref:Uncharacterized protein n=1 Tax=Ciona intestinalis TaxID=7719 RepID=H2XLP6_CIOIN